MLSEVVKSQTCSASGGKPAVTFANEPTFINKSPFTAAKLADRHESSPMAEESKVSDIEPVQKNIVVVKKPSGLQQAFEIRCS